MISALDDTDLRQWFEIAVQGLEAEVRGAPPARTVTDATVEPYYTGLAEALSAADLATVVALTNGETVADAPVCSAWRGIYKAMLALPTVELTLVARYDVSP